MLITFGGATEMGRGAGQELQTIPCTCSSLAGKDYRNDNNFLFAELAVVKIWSTALTGEAGRKGMPGWIWGKGEHRALWLGVACTRG